MMRLGVILALSLALGGCLTPSAFRQSKGLVGQPISEAVTRYGEPDQPVGAGAAAYSWSRGRGLGACKLSVRTDASGRITNASVVAIGLQSCNSVLKRSAGG